MNAPFSQCSGRGNETEARCSRAPAIFLVCALLSPVVAMAQSLDRSPAARASRAAARAADFRAALGFASAGNGSAAEAALFKANVQRPNSLEWDIEAATKLAHLALTLRERSDYRNARLCADRAIALLNSGLTARSTGASPARRAQAFETAGFIYERLHFDHAAARAAFAQAQTLQPSSMSAAAGLARIKDREDAEKRVRGGKG